MTFPIRILQATVSNDKGGLTGYICQNYRYIDKSKVQFDFLTYETQLDFQKEFEKMGARFYVVPKPSHFFAYMKALKQICKQTEYGAVHFNISYANFLPLLAAKSAGFKRIIIHSHSTEIDDKRKLVRGMKKCIHYVGKMLMPVLGTDFLACSQLAGEWMYPASVLHGGKYHLAKNAINLEKYRFNPAIRKRVRAELGIGEQTFCVGHIGRFSYQKNHSFLIRVFAEVHKKQPDSCLLLIGGHMNGDEYYTEAKKLVEQLYLEESVHFLGVRKDVPELLQAMDCFVLPSRFEGLGIVGIEAQATGLQCFVSDRVPQELNVCGNVLFLPIDYGTSKWSKALLEGGKIDRCLNNRLAQTGYDIHSSIKNMESFYKNQT